MAKRRAAALEKMDELRRQGLEVKPVEIRGRKIARTFWGQAWCGHLESFSDYENRLPRGRTYVRNGSVCHLEIAGGLISALVSGSKIYSVKIAIETLPKNKWLDLKKSCAGQVGSLLELLQGRLSGNVMAVMTDPNKGLFPQPGEISFRCSCPDWAVMCKHVAAVLYGVGARLDEEPALLFLLRGVDHEELISTEAGLAVTAIGTKGGRRRIADDDLAEVFGIDITKEAAPAATGREKTAPKSVKSSRLADEHPVGPKVKGGMAKARAKKTAQCKAGPGKSSPAATSAGRPTGREVAGLRARFGMSQREFARLLGVSAPTIGNWERRPGQLDLRSRSLDAWRKAKKLGKRQARRKLVEA